MRTLYIFSVSKLFQIYFQTENFLAYENDEIKHRKEKFDHGFFKHFLFSFKIFIYETFKPPSLSGFSGFGISYNGYLIYIFNMYLPCHLTHQ